jgi:hypothetical protein
MTAWIVPTARAVGWLPLAAVAVLLVGTSALTAYAGRWPLEMLGIAAGAVAAATVAGLHDPAASLLSASPTSSAARRGQRMALLVPAALAVWAGYLWPGQTVSPPPGWPLAPMLALLAGGLAVAAWAPNSCGVAAGVALPLLWAALGRMGGELDHPFSDVLLPWQHHPWLVTTAAVAALAWRRTP